MPIEVMIHKEEKLVEMKFSGLISFDDFREELGKLIEYASLNGKMNYLLDFREAKPKGKTWTIEMINPKFWRESSKYCEGIALLVPTPSINSLQIFNIIARNAGLNFRVFATDRQKACEWLGVPVKIPNS